MERQGGGGSLTPTTIAMLAGQRPRQTFGRHRDDNTMTRDPHFSALERMYLAAPINEFYRPTIVVTDSEASIEADVRKDFFHAFGAVHGSVYFKMLDDAAFFAANSLERELVVVTTSFTTYLTRPVSAGGLRAVGRVVNRNRSQFVAEAVLYDADDNELGRGSGVFVRSKIRLGDIDAYAGALDARAWVQPPGLS